MNKTPEQLAAEIGSKGPAGKRHVRRTKFGSVRGYVGNKFYDYLGEGYGCDVDYAIDEFMGNEHFDKE